MPMTLTSTFLAKSLRLTIPALALAWLMIQPMAAEELTSEVVEYRGTATAAREAEVSPRIDGLLLKINFTAGKLVNKGDLLFEFGASDKELSLAAAKASLQQAEAQLRLAEVNLKNAETLRGRNVAESPADARGIRRLVIGVLIRLGRTVRLVVLVRRGTLI